MPQERTVGGRANPVRPLKPTLASNRTVRSPITPRIAAPPKNPFPQTLISRSESNINLKTRPSSEALHASTPSNLVHKANPRPLSRVSRLESASTRTSPTLEHTRNNGTTQASSPATWSTPRTIENLPRRPQSVLGAGSTARSPLVRAKTMGAPDPSRQPSNTTPNALSNKFFRANEKSPERLAAGQTKRPAVFFYANGTEAGETDQPSTSPSPPLSAVSARSGKAQFFYATTATETGYVDVSSPVATPVASPTVNSPTADSVHSPPMFFQPLPGGLNNIHLSYRKGASQIIRPGKLQSPVIPPNPSAPTSPLTLSHSLSAKIDPNALLNHRRASSLGSIDSGSSVRHSSAGESLPANSRSSKQAPASGITTWRPQNIVSVAAATNSTIGPDARQSSISKPSPAQLLPALSLSPKPGRGTVEEDQGESTGLGIGTLESSEKSTIGSQDPALMAGLASNARRERKVMDLEISNSSLLAINRQLEKEVRRQKVELRRFRRLSRVGRLSSLPETFRRTRDDLGAGDDEASSIVSGVDESDGEDEDDETDSLSDIDSEDLSPDALAEHDERRIAKDSKRLQLDLQKHRELLIDSQKLNQSLRRCMAWTEEMLKEGKKQLDHRVRVSDVKLGGRILHHQDELEPLEEGAGDGLVDDAAIGKPGGSLLGPWQSATAGREQIDEDVSEHGFATQDGIVP